MKPEKQILEQTVHECQQGNRQAQKRLFDHLAPAMFAVCLQYTRNHTEAEDCLQDGFVKVFTKIKDFRSEGPFEAWVRRIMVNTAIEHYRKKPKSYDTTDIDTIAHKIAVTDNDPAGLNAEHLLNLIKVLPEQYQLVFTLFALEGMTHDEISKSLNITTGTSKSNLSRARAWLQKRLHELNTLENQHYEIATRNR